MFIVCTKCSTGQTLVLFILHDIYTPRSDQKREISQYEGKQTHMANLFRG